MKKIILAIIATILGHTAWVSSLVNFVWLLVKDVTLFSWWWPIGFAVGFLVAIGTTLFFIVTE
jgi:hypothetical protein